MKSPNIADSDGKYPSVAALWWNQNLSATHTMGWDDEDQAANFSQYLVEPAMTWFANKFKLYQRASLKNMMKISTPKWQSIAKAFIERILKASVASSFIGEYHAFARIHGETWLDLFQCFSKCTAMAYPKHREQEHIKHLAMCFSKAPSKQMTYFSSHVIKCRSMNQLEKEFVQLEGTLGLKPFEHYNWNLIPRQANQLYFENKFQEATNEFQTRWHLVSPERSHRFRRLKYQTLSRLHNYHPEVRSPALQTIKIMTTFSVTEFT